MKLSNFDRTLRMQIDIQHLNVVCGNGVGDLTQQQQKV